MVDRLRGPICVPHGGLLAPLVRGCIRAKKPGHGIDSDQFVKPQRAMYQIGG